MPRPTIGDAAMTAAERQRRRRQRLKQEKAAQQEKAARSSPPNREAEFEYRVHVEVRRRLAAMRIPVMDKRTWRRILKRLHPDHGGDAELTDIWIKLEKRLVAEG